MLNTATGYLALLQEDDIEFKSIALDKLNLLVDDHWSEISDYIKTLKGYYERKEIPDKEYLLALILSKIYYNLEDYDSAIEWALESGDKFNIAERGLYVSTILKKILDKYIIIRKKNFYKPENKIIIDPRISHIIESVFNACLVKKKITQAIGFCVESFDLERLAIAIESNNQIRDNLQYVYTLTQDIIVNNEYKMAILDSILRMYAKHANTHYMDITNCQFLLNNTEALASTLFNILKNESDPLIAYQIAFDLLEKQNPSYLRMIMNEIKKINSEKNIPEENIDKLLKILSGEISRKTIMACLEKKNNTDMISLKSLIKTVEKGGSVVHLGVILSNSLLNSHTGKDAFLKENLEWVGKASNWGRFITTSSLGVIHKGNFEKGMELMKPYLPGNPTIPSVYAHGGAFYGLGIIYANSNDGTVLKFLLDALNGPANNKEAILHGIYLAIGLVAMGSHDLKLYEQIRDGIYTDDAIIGEAAGYAAGLIMAGSKNYQAIDDLVKYSHDTQHEKIIRAIAISLSLIVYGAEEGADTLIEQLQREKDPILRYGSTYCVGMAYAGTGNTTALKKLIKISVSDVNDDVRRAALINIGFLSIKNPDILFDNLKVLSLLSESYNSHVRYGAVMAIGIAYAGSAKYNPYKIIHPLFTDPSYLVRQASLLASGMIFSQTTVAQEPGLSSLKENLTKIISDKDEHVLIRFGGLISQGLMELGGRNCNLNLVASTRDNKMTSIIGMALFTQYYYWFPMIHFINLAVNPTLLIGVDSNMKIVTNYTAISKAKPSIYGYPVEPLIQEKVKVAKVESAVLSTHTRTKAKGRKTATLTELKPSPSGEIPTKDPDEKKDKDIVMNGNEKEDTKIASTVEKKAVEEPLEEQLMNPMRIIPRQKGVISVINDQDFIPIIPGRLNGFVLLKKTKDDAVALYDDEKEVIVGKIDPKDSGASGNNQYHPLPTDDVEMPEDIDITDIK